MPDNFINKTLAFAQFNKIKFENNIINFVSKIYLSTQKMKLVGLKVEEELTIILTLPKLPSEFNYLKKSDECKNKNINYILKRLEKDEAQAKINPFDQLSDPVHHALYNRPPVCPHCNKPGHPAKNCWVKYPEKAPKSMLRPGSNKMDEAHFYTF